MEILKPNKVIFPNIRQTKNWEKYFNLLGWNSFKLSNGSYVLYLKTVLGAFGKMLRPVKLDEKLLLELDEKCKEYNLLFLKLEPELDQDLNLLTQHGYVLNKSPIVPASIMYLDISVPEKILWNNLSDGRKYDLKRGAKEKIRVEFIKNPTEDQIKYFYDNALSYTAHYKNFNIPSLAATLCKTRTFKEDTYLSLAYDAEDNFCSGKLFLTFDKVAFYLYSGANEVGNKNKAGFVQMWESIKYFKNLGFEILDFDGVYDDRFPGFSKRWKGFTSFKEKFGCKTIQYPNPYLKVFNPFLKFILNVTRVDL